MSIFIIILFSSLIIFLMLKLKCIKEGAMFLVNANNFDLLRDRTQVPCRLQRQTSCH